MTKLMLDSIAVDCPNPVALSSFYAELLGVENRGDFFYLPGEQIEVWFQQVEGYQPPTWPTQERGQQLHFDFTVPDIEAAVSRAIERGATLTERRNGYHYPILIDPMGHPFCLIAGSETNLVAVGLDCDDQYELATFYQGLIGGEIEKHSEWINLSRPGDLTLCFQHVEGYQPPTWPTQERGQQIHIDFHTSEREKYVQRAIKLGATQQVVEKGFTVLFDPAGHPFCICDSRE